MQDDTAMPSCTVLLRPGEFCKGPSMQFAPFPICPHHLLKIIKAEWQMPRVMQAAANKIPHSRKAPLFDSWAKQKRMDQSVVYYVRIGEHIKIGYTTNLAQRLTALRVRPDGLLATEPGGFGMEQARHKQFKDIRIDRREDFRPTPKLLEHIESIKDRCGEPKITGHIGRYTKVE